MFYALGALTQPVTRTSVLPRNATIRFAAPDSPDYTVGNYLDDNLLDNLGGNPWRAFITLEVFLHPGGVVVHSQGWKPLERDASKPFSPKGVVV